PAGDALLAHELAHVAQQSGGSSPAPEQLAEDDANQAAMSAVAATHGGALDRFPAKARTGFGLSLNRCSGFDDSPLAFTPLPGSAAEANSAELGGTMRQDPPLADGQKALVGMSMQEKLIVTPREDRVVAVERWEIDVPGTPKAAVSISKPGNQTSHVFQQ